MSDSVSHIKASISKLRQLAPAAWRRNPPQTGNIDRVQQGVIEGWVKAPDSDTPLVVDIFLDGHAIATNVRADLYRQDVEEAGIGDGRFGFTGRLPRGKTRENTRIEVRLSSSQKLLLSKVVTKQPRQPDIATPSPVTSVAERSAPVASGRRSLSRGTSGIEGKLEAVTADVLRGWAVDAGNIGRMFNIDVLVDGVFLVRIKNDQTRGDLRRLGKADGKGGFRLELFLNDLEPGAHTVTVVLPDGRELSETVTTKANARRIPLNSGVVRIDASEVAVIVPIYNAADDLEICLQRLAAYTPPEMDILLIDDASPDPRIAALLTKAEAMPNVRVLRNEHNLGFTRTINRGLAEIGTKHAILLNSDARVTPGWARGMLRAASSRPRVATVTAMSDRAGAFSAPKIGNDNQLPVGVDEITYARAFRRRSLGLYPVVPTGNGFCMFVNRDCVNEIGALDDEAFPRGYGEENDFCMRAGRAGWTHLIDDRTYVFHDRSKSFGDAKADLLAAGRAVVDQRYPEYSTAIRVFHTDARLSMARLRAAQALIDCNNPKVGLPVILYVVATQTGGTPQTNMDLMQEMSDEMAPWLLHCDSRKMTLSRLDGKDLVSIRTHQLSEAVNPLTHASAEYDAVVQDWLEIANPRIVHIRHLAWHGLSLPALAKQRGSQVVFSFHDFYTLCPTIKLLDENNVFCGGVCTKTDGECQVELWSQDDLPHIKDSWVHVWRERFAKVLADCDAYVTTSDSARERIGTQLGLDMEKFFVIPHGRNFTEMAPQRTQPQEGAPVRILLPGNISAAKGRDIVTALLEHDREGRLEFHVLGAISEPDKLKDYPNLILHGTYQRDEFAQLVYDIDPHMGAVFSIWDETYCHTLTELWATGLPAIVFDFPTVAGRVRASGAGWVVPHTDIPALYDRILAISFDRTEQMRADLAVLDWQKGSGAGRTTKVMAAGYRDVYRYATGVTENRPTVAVVGPASANLQTANASTAIRLWERTINGPNRECVFVRMTPESLLANVRDGIVDLAILQRNVIPADLAPALLAEMEAAGVRYLLDLDDDLLSVSADKDPSGAYAAYAPTLETIINAAATVTTSTDRLRSKLQGMNPNIALLRNRLSERLWRGALPARKEDKVVRALYMGTATHKDDFDMIAPALAAVAAADPNFRVTLIGVHDDDLPPWADRIMISQELRNYANFVPWLKAMSGDFDFALAPLVDTPFNQFKSNLKVIDSMALGLPVLASDMPVFQPAADKMPDMRLVDNTTEAWRTALTDMIADVRAGVIDRGEIRDRLLAEFGLASTLPVFDAMLVSLARSTGNPDEASGTIHAMERAE